MPTDAKRHEIAELAELLRSSSALAVADYRGLTVSEMQSVRRSLRANGVQLHVAKNRLLKIAAAEAGRDELTSLLSGPTALASSSGDETGLAKALQDALRPYSKVVALRGGLLGINSVRRFHQAAPSVRAGKNHRAAIRVNGAFHSALVVVTEQA